MVCLVAVGQLLIVSGDGHSLHNHRQTGIAEAGVQSRSRVSVHIKSGGRSVSRSRSMLQGNRSDLKTTHRQRRHGACSMMSGWNAELPSAVAASPLKAPESHKIWCNFGWLQPPHKISCLGANRAPDRRLA